MPIHLKTLICFTSFNFKNKDENSKDTSPKRAVKYDQEIKLETSTPSAVAAISLSAPSLPKVNIINPDPIKIFDQTSKEVAYKSLNISEKQRVLSELLFNSALKNISKNRIVNMIFRVKHFKKYFNYFDHTHSSLILIMTRTQTKTTTLTNWTR